MPEILYGLGKNDLESAKNMIEAVLDLSFVLHDSIERCGDYYRYKEDEMGIIIQLNFDSFDREWQTDFTDHDVIMYVYAPQVRLDAIDESLRTSLKSLELLERRSYG